MAGVNIVGSDGHVLSGDDAACHMLVGLAEAGMVDPVHVIGQITPRLSQIQARTPALIPRIQALTARVAPNLMMQMGGGGANLAALGAAIGQGIGAQAGAHVEQSAQGPLRDVVQGLDSGAVLIGAGVTFDLTFNATMAFRPERVVVGPAVAPFWAITDIKVSADSLFLQTGPVPAESFLPDGVTAPALKRRTAQPGTPILVQIQNVDVIAHRFRASLFGKATDTGSC